MTEGIVGRQDEPALAALRYDRTCSSDRLGVSIERPMKAGGRAIFIGQSRRCWTDRQGDLSLVVGDLLNRERDRGICQFGDGAHIFKIKPAARYVGREVRL